MPGRRTAGHQRLPVPQPRAAAASSCAPGTGSFSLAGSAAPCSRACRSSAARRRLLPGERGHLATGGVGSPAGAGPVRVILEDGRRPVECATGRRASRGLLNNSALSSDPHQLRARRRNGREAKAAPAGSAALRSEGLSGRPRRDDAGQQVTGPHRPRARRGSPEGSRSPGARGDAGHGIAPGVPGHCLHRDIPRGEAVRREVCQTDRPVK